MRAIVAHNELLFRRAVKVLLERDGIEVVAEASDGRQAVKLAGQFRPEVVLMDAHLALLNGIDATRIILKTLPATKCIVLADELAWGSMREALDAGVAGFVLKSSPDSELTKAIQEVCRGTIYLDPGSNLAFARALAEEPGGGVECPLTVREREVLQLICEGKTVKEIADILGIGQKTVESHRQRITSKLNVSQTAELVRYAVRNGLIRACVCLSVYGTAIYSQQ
jgi:two-component system response regulator NreC